MKWSEKGKCHLVCYTYRLNIDFSAVAVVGEEQEGNTSDIEDSVDDIEEDGSQYSQENEPNTMEELNNEVLVFLCYKRIYRTLFVVATDI